MGLQETWMGHQETWMGSQEARMGSPLVILRNNALSISDIQRIYKYSAVQINWILFAGIIALLIIKYV